MTETSKDPWAKPFANGFAHFCEYCGKFFSITTSINPDEKPNFCPWCGDDGILSTQREFIGWCIDRDEDPISHFYVLSGSDPVPGSKYQVSPNQIEHVQNVRREMVSKGNLTRPDRIAFAAGLPESITAVCLEILEAGEWE